MRKLNAVYAYSGRVMTAPVVHITDEGKALCLVGRSLINIEKTSILTFIGYELAE